MARLFVLEVMNQTLAPASAVAYSSGNLYERLGQADNFAFQLVVDQVTGSGNVTFDYQDSNEGSDGLFSSSSKSTAPITATLAVSTTGTFWISSASTTRVLGGFGRVMIQLPAGISSMSFRLYACGRSDG